MTLLRKILRTKIFIIDSDNDFVRLLKQLFARGIENHIVMSYCFADEFLANVDQFQIKKIERNVIVISITAHAEGASISETLEKIRQKMNNAYVILIYNSGEMEKHEINMYKTEMLIDDFIEKNNFARMRIQNAIRRVLSRDDLNTSRKLLYISGSISITLLIITLVLFFV